MRQIKNSLNGTFEMDGAQFVEHQGDKNRHWETENQLQEIDDQRIFQRIRKADGTEDFFEKAKAYPCAFLKRTRNTKIAKSDLEIIQRIIAENQIERALPARPIEADDGEIAWRKSLLFMKMRRGVYPAPRLWFLREPYPAGYYSPAHSWRGFRDSDRGRRLSAFAGIRPTSRQYPFRQSTRRCDMR